MKPKTRSILALLVVVAALISGCTTTGSGGGYQLKQTRQDVDWAMVRYHNRVSFGFLTSQEQQRVSDAYKAYQSAFNTALQQANGNLATPTPASVKQLADQLFSILDSIP
jgi:predicted small secreted protein